MKTILWHKSSLMSCLAAVVLLSACAAPFGPPGYWPWGASPEDLGDEPNAQNGERIYFTAASLRGTRIRYRGGPAYGGMMMGSYLACASCHGPDARGGLHSMHMWLMDAPNIRYEALSAESGEHSEEHKAYGLEQFRRAVILGEHPDGQALSQDMPRWQMSDQDLADLLAYLQSLEGP